MEDKQLSVFILGGWMGGFTPIFENSPLFFQRLLGGKFYIEKEGKKNQQM
jgi:hypothetical protein